MSQPSSGEEAMRIAEMLVKTNAVDIVVVDPLQRWCQKRTTRRNWRSVCWSSGSFDESVVA